MSTASAKAASTRRSRNESPAPKPAVKPEAKVAVKPVEKEEEKPVEKKEDKENYICGVHSDVFKVLVLGPLAVAVIITTMVFFDAAALVAQHWAKYSGVVGTFLTKNADMIVVAVVAVCLAPLAIVSAVTIFHATMDLGQFAWWQQALLGALVFGSLATLYTLEGALWTLDAVEKQWARFSDPIEAILLKKTDAIIAGAAVCCLAPIVGSLIIFLLRTVWNCRVKIVVEAGDKED